MSKVRNIDFDIEKRFIDVHVDKNIEIERNVDKSFISVRKNTPRFFDMEKLVCVENYVKENNLLNLFDKIYYKNDNVVIYTKSVNCYNFADLKFLVKHFDSSYSFNEFIKMLNKLKIKNVVDVDNQENYIVFFENYDIKTNVNDNEALYAISSVDDVKFLSKNENSINN